MIALEKPKVMAMPKPRKDGERVSAREAFGAAMAKFPKTMAHLAK